MTLIEMMVALSILSGVLAIFSSLLFSVQTGVSRASDRTISNDEARVAVQQIDREIRSGNVFTAPTDDGYSVVIYSQANFPTRPQGHRCVEWRVADEELQSRSWHVDWEAFPELVGPWRIVARHIENRDENVPPFALDTSTEYGGDGVHGRVMRIQIVTQKAEGSGQPVEISVAVNGRNTRYGDTRNPCDSPPPE